MSSGEDSGERNPFAPPPPGAPDQPWRPRTPRPPATGQQPDGQPEEDHTQPPPWGRRPEPGPQQPSPPKLDPADPAHRTARNALLSGFAALLAVLFGLYWLAFPLSLLAVWYAVAVLRIPAEPTADPFSPRPVRPQVPAALSALLTGGLALVVSLGVFGMQFTYRDYLGCRENSVTQEAARSCAQEYDVPAWLSNLYEVADE
ncbi:hypothetical protein [Kitasatospora phosalacinea]|uniref:hypothetical protein n=1 Tax=Kitasatospora phosalacinea TaxID=2065 RepID=UPI00068FC4F6|nr:hypothetical protein [Kitasatospora phosalacinea]